MRVLDLKKLSKWLTIDMIFFVALNIVLLYYLGDRIEFLIHIGIFKLLILGLAVYRGANILSNEVITKPLRAPFVDEKEVNGKVVESPKKKGFAGAFGLLIFCPSCTGVWIAAILIYLYAFLPGVTFVIWLLLASSALERIFSALVEHLKKK
jgi:hypothetical protein